MELYDYIGNYEGIYKIDMQYEYDENDLPKKIIRETYSAFDFFRDTLVINYE